MAVTLALKNAKRGFDRPVEWLEWSNGTLAFVFNNGLAEGRRQRAGARSAPIAGITEIAVIGEAAKIEIIPRIDADSRGSGKARI